MPKRNDDPYDPNGPATTESTDLTAFLSDEVRMDLLRSQGNQVTTEQAIPNVRVMPAAALLFEFTDTLETVREFTGVVLHSHPRNILWDRPFGERPDDEENAGPACSSKDGQYGRPRPGFVHLALGRNYDLYKGQGGLPGVIDLEEWTVATGDEQIECARCPYNKWRSRTLIDPTAAAKGREKGKAVTNQKSVYIMLPGRVLPTELRLPPTSITAFDKYITQLMNQGKPYQTVLTRFYQERVAGPPAYGQAVFALSGPADPETIQMALQKRKQFWRQMNPSFDGPGSDSPTTASSMHGGALDDRPQDDLPF